MQKKLKPLYVICIDARNVENDPVIWFKGTALEVDSFMQRKQEELESCGLDTTYDEGWYKTFEFDGEEVFHTAIVAGFVTDLKIISNED